MPTIAELGQKVKAKYPGAYDDLPDDELGRKLKAKFPGSYDDFTDTAPPASHASPDIMDYIPALPSTPFRFSLGQAADAAPAIGGIFGGITGGIPGAALYGAAGESMKRAVRRMPMDPKAIALAGGKQAAYEAGGAALGVGAALASKGVAAGSKAAEAALANPFVRRALRRGGGLLPLGGGLTHGIPGMLAGAALPLAVRGAIRMGPKAAELIGSDAFIELARHAPSAAARLYRKTALAEQADATRTQ